MDARALISDLVGIPFLDRGRTIKGADCWGLCMLAFDRLGYVLPEYSVGAYEKEIINETIQKDRLKWIALDKPESPCLVLMRLGVASVINHCGIYLGNGEMLHTRGKTGSVIEDVSSIRIRNLIQGYVKPPEDFRK